MSYFKELKELIEQYSQIIQITTNQSIKAFETAQKNLQPLMPILKAYLSGQEKKISEKEQNILDDSIMPINNFLLIRPFLSEKATITLQSKFKTAEDLQKIITDIKNKEYSRKKNNLSIIDKSELDLTESELVQFTKTLDLLQNSEIFTYYYKQLLDSNDTYKISSKRISSGSGAYDAENKSIHLHSLDVYTVSQEIMHAYQSLLNVYTKADQSVREAEGDLISSAICLAVDDYAFKDEEWSQNIPYEYTDNNFNYDERVLTREFDEIFNIAVEARIKMYKERENSPESYIKDNSGVGALAIKQLVRNLKSKE